MEHLGWFLAGTSFGLIVGAGLTSLAKFIERLGEQERSRAESRRRPALLVMRRQG
jgi:hypothetical protein